MHFSSRLFSKYLKASHAPRQQVAAQQLESGPSYIEGPSPSWLSLFFSRSNDRLQQHNTRPSGLNQLHVLYWTICIGQYGILYYSIIQSTVVQYGLLSVLGVISNPNHTHRIFGRVSNNFDCPSELQVDTASLSRPWQPMRTTFGALPAAQAPRTRTGCENACETLCTLWSRVVPGLVFKALDHLEISDRG